MATAASNAGSVFSGASPPPPRWAKAIVVDVPKKERCTMDVAVSVADGSLTHPGSRAGQSAEEGSRRAPVCDADRTDAAKPRLGTGAQLDPRPASDGRDQLFRVARREPSDEARLVGRVAEESGGVCEDDQQRRAERDRDLGGEPVPVDVDRGSILR